jgi:hypothetical protein
MDKFLLIFALICFGFSQSVQASQGPLQPECQITGKITQESTRLVPGNGISEGETFLYNDLLIELKSNSCADKPQIETYQLRSDVRKRKGYVGKCISANNRWFGDGNFMSGDWVYDIVILDDKDCD